VPFAFGFYSVDKTGGGLDRGDGTHKEDGSCIPDEEGDADPDADTGTSVECLKYEF
jgi:hypothetical protein